MVPAVPVKRGEKADEEHDAGEHVGPTVLRIRQAMRGKESDEKAESDPKCLSATVRPKPFCKLVVFCL
jgi:hypothetical protein